MNNEEAKEILIDMRNKCYDVMMQNPDDPSQPEQRVKAFDMAIQKLRTNTKKIYIVGNTDNNYSTAIRMTEEQARAIEWFIDWADVDDHIYIELADEFAKEIEDDA